MKLKIRHAVAAAMLLGAAGSASAFDISTYTGTPLYVGGSTAIDKALLAWFEETADTNSPCITNDSNNPIDVYTGTQAGIKFIAVACTANTANTGSVADSNGHIVFIKEDNGGSLNGILGVGLPANGGTTLTFPVVSGLTATACDNTPKGAVAGVTSAFNSHNCPGTGTTTTYTSLTTPIQANLGFADVEAGIFGKDAGFNASTDPTGLDLVGKSTIDIVFAPAVSLGLYHALQSAEGLTPDDATGDMPSLSSAVLSSIFTNKITDWSKITDVNGAVSAQTSIQFGTSGGTSHEYNGGAPGNPAGTKIYFCRRDDGSGTEKTSEIVFGNNVCTTGNQTFRAAVNQTNGNSWTQPASLSAEAVTFAGSGTGAVLNCLQGTDQLGGYAIGYASVDNGWGSKGTTNASTGIGTQDFRYVKVDGVIPSIENAASGKYRYWAQSSLYTPGSQSGHNPASGDALVLQNYLTGVTKTSAGIGSAAAIGALDASNQWTNGPTWDGGVLGIPGNVGNTPNASSGVTVAQFRLNPVNDFVKASGGNDNCQAPIGFNTTPITAGASGTVSWSSP